MFLITYENVKASVYIPQPEKNNTSKYLRESLWPRKNARQTECRAAIVNLLQNQTQLAF